jgi:predicted PurR-regulated permease PerM
MSLQKKTSLPTFTSLRIIGERAQKFIQKARALHAKKQMVEDDIPQDPNGARPVVVVHLSLHNIIRSAFVVLAMCVGVLLIYFLRDKIVVVLLSIFVATIIDPGVQAMHRWGIPRSIAILIHYAIALFLLIFLVISLIPIIADQIQQIAVFTSTQVDSFLANPHISFPYLTPDVNARLTVVAGAFTIAKGVVVLTLVAPPLFL